MIVKCFLFHIALTFVYYSACCPLLLIVWEKIKTGKESERWRPDAEVRSQLLCCAIMVFKNVVYLILLLNYGLGVSITMFLCKESQFNVFHKCEAQGSGYIVE